MSVREAGRAVGFIGSTSNGGLCWGSRRRR